jgi:hypothetical protein
MTITDFDEKFATAQVAWTERIAKAESERDFLKRELALLAGAENVQTALAIARSALTTIKLYEERGHAV